MYFLYGKSSGEQSRIAYVMQNTGECEWYILHRLYFTNNELDSVQSIRYGSIDNPFNVIGRTSTEMGYRMFPDDSGFFSAGYRSFGVSASEPDTLKVHQIDSLIIYIANGHLAPEEWKAHPYSFGDDSLYYLQEPNIVSSGTAELIYYDPQGLYTDYDIRDVVYWPESKIMWIETHQPREMVGGDGMHGVLIYKLHFK
jgi:hypothetical protein